MQVERTGLHHLFGATAHLYACAAAWYCAARHSPPSLAGLGAMEAHKTLPFACVSTAFLPEDRAFLCGAASV